MASASILTDLQERLGSGTVETGVSADSGATETGASTGVGATETGASTGSGLAETDSSTGAEVMDADSSAYTGRAPWGYCYDSLTADQKTAYDAIFEAAAMDWESIEFDPVSVSDLSDAYDAFFDDHPEFFWIETLTYSTTTDDSSQDLAYEVNLVWNMDAKERDAQKATIESKADGFIASLGPDLTTYDKVKAAYEYIVLNTIYVGGVNDQNIASVFIEGGSVCAGYACAFQYLLQRMDIPCAYVSGYLYDRDGIFSGRHAWNIVEIDGVSTYVDCTYGDYSNVTGGNGINYNFLCITTAEIARDRGIDHEEWYPECTDTTYDYYRQNGIYFDSYDAGSVTNVLVNSYLSGEAAKSIKFGSMEALQAACVDLVDNDALLNALSPYLSRGTVVSYVYEIDDTLCTLTYHWS